MFTSSLSGKLRKYKSSKAESQRNLGAMNFMLAVSLQEDGEIF